MFILLVTTSSLQLKAQQTNGLTDNIITDKPKTETDFPIVSLEGSVATIRYDTGDYKGVFRAVNDLKSDIDSVTGLAPKLVTSEVSAG
jgi:hypothetical protein